MKGKKKINPYWVSFCIIGVIALVIFADFIYRKSKETETWVVCEFKPVYSNYDETIKFRYIAGKIYGFYRYETINKPKNKNVSLDEIYQTMLKQKPNIENSEYFNYEVKKEKDGIFVNTYINIEKYQDDFDTYVTDLYISSSFNARQMKKALESTN